MKLNIKKSFLFSIVLILLLVPTAYAIPGTWRGFVITDGSLAASGTVVDGYVSNITKSGNATVKEVSTMSDGYYLINVVGVPGDKVNFKVCGVNVSIPSQDWSVGLHPNGTDPYINLSVSKLATGVSCMYSCGCSGGHCCSDATEYTAGEGTGTCQASACVAPTATTAAPSPGGGGVTGTTATTTPPVKETKTVASIAAGGTGTFSFETVPISEIDVEVKNAVTNVQIAVTKTDAAPATVSIAAPGTVYAYFNIEKINVDDANVNKITIKFKVEKSWITSNNIDVGTITMNRYVNGTWVALTTKLVSSNGYYYFEAESPGLSVFVVIAQKKPVTTTAPSATTTVPVTTTTIPIVIKPENYVWILVVIIIIVLIFLIWKFYKKIRKKVQSVVPQQ
jgi:PGF-pre-PGF domain-containing protein